MFFIFFSIIQRQPEAVVAVVIIAVSSRSRHQAGIEAVTMDGLKNITIVVIGKSICDSVLILY